MRQPLGEALAHLDTARRLLGQASGAAATAPALALAALDADVAYVRARVARLYAGEALPEDDAEACLREVCGWDGDGSPVEAA